MNRFLFVFSRRCKNSTPAFRWLIKAPPPLRLICKHTKPLKRC